MTARNSKPLATARKRSAPLPSLSQCRARSSVADSGGARVRDAVRDLELADQVGAWFGRYDLNDFHFLGVRKRKLGEGRRTAAVPGR